MNELPTPPMMPSPPVVGHTFQFMKEPVDVIRRGHQSLGDVFGIRLGRKNVAVLIGPEHHRVFFGETDKKLNMQDPYEFLASALGKIAFTAGPETYQRQRPVLHAPFKSRKFARYLEVMQLEIERWLDGLGQEGTVELTHETDLLVQRVAGHALMGPTFNEEVGAEFWALYADLSAALDPVLPPNLPLPKFWRRDRARKRMVQILTPIIQRRRLDPDGEDDFLQELVSTPDASGEVMRDEDLVDLIMGLLFAGHETTAGQAAWNVIELARHPEHLAIAREQIDAAITPGEPLELRRLSGLKHIAWSVREIERLHPSATMLLRGVDEELEVGGFRVPAGWSALVCPAVAHRLPSLFADPDRFDPSRYAPGREEDKQDRFALIGFGGGLHKCTGMNFANQEIMLISALMLQRFDVEVLTREITTTMGKGAARPSPTHISYRLRGMPALRAAS